MNKGYPRPQLKRTKWIDLNGTWAFCFDDDDQGRQLGYPTNFPAASDILVPFSYETKRSGIGETKRHDIVWYHRTIHHRPSKPVTLLHFGAVDYLAEVYLNGTLVGTHEGGNLPFSFDVSQHLNKQSENHLVVRVEDNLEDREILRGKQYWKETSESIFYTRTTGIWQTVWMEDVPATRIDAVRFTPDLDRRLVQVDVTVINGEDQPISILVQDEFNYQTSLTIPVTGETTSVNIDLADNPAFNDMLWSPEQPHLYDVTIHLKDDTIQSYFGMRKVHVDEDNRFCLNNQPYYMRLVLDQGYYPDSLLTSPDDDALIRDIELTKQMGFNGVRKHQKIEEERYLYHADRLGLLVWGELPSAYVYTERSQQNIRRELGGMIQRDYNHPSIIVWVPINESWGVPDLPKSSEQRQFLDELYHLVKSLDDTRLVVSNDGWEHSTTDLFTVHDYESKYDVLKARYADMNVLLASKPGYKPLWNNGYDYQGQPLLVSEFGGISYQMNGAQGWGYSSANDAKELHQRLQAVFLPLFESSYVQGFCYTQLTDVEQEINGLLTYDREPKLPLDLIKQTVTNISS